MYASRNGGIVGVEPFRCGLVVVGAYHQQSVNSGVFGGLAQGNGVGGGVGACARNDDHVLRGGFFRPAEHGQLFFVRQGRGFPGGAAEDAGGNVGLCLPVDQLLQHGVIDSPF